MLHQRGAAQARSVNRRQIEITKVPRQSPSKLVADRSKPSLLAAESMQSRFTPTTTILKASSFTQRAGRYKRYVTHSRASRWLTKQRRGASRFVATRVRLPLRRCLTCAWVKRPALNRLQAGTTSCGITASTLGRSQRLVSRYGCERRQL